MSGYLLGYDIGSSSIKAVLIDSANGRQLASISSPEKELSILAPQTGWAEQDPNVWWENVVIVTNKIKLTSGIDIADIKGIGISYQMHGLVMLDKNHSILHPAIIWCDSRAVEIGKQAFKNIGKEKCLKNLLNSPGNFTASKLNWVKNNLPDLYGKVNKIMLPGDFIAFKMTGQIKTTPSGLSEGILWDFKEHDIAGLVTDYFGIPESFIPEIVPTFSVQGELTKKAARELGLKSGTKISYRAGDQPNNAFSLNVLEPGEIAATAGTSGVVYGVSDKANYDNESRVNTFVHVNYEKEKPRYGTLLCINGTGILNSWIKHNLMTLQNICIDYEEINQLAAKIPVGSDGLVVLPFGNGAERSLGDKEPQASFSGINFNIHTKEHILRAAQEGIAFAFNYGLEIMHSMDISTSTIRAGYSNMFLSPLFSKSFAAISNSKIELYNTDGSEGAARGAGVGVGIYKNFNEAFTGLEIKKIIEPDLHNRPAYLDAYEKWKQKLEMNLAYL